MNTTKRPWHVNAIRSGRIIGDETAEGAEKFMIANSNATVATVYRPSDARFLCNAVNAHDALVTAVEKLMGVILNRGLRDEPTRFVFHKADVAQLQEIAESALRLARGES